MNQGFSRTRLSVLAVLLVVETALAISLRTTGWAATGRAIHALPIVIAIVLPFVMTAVLLYRVRVSLRRGQFSLRALLAFTLIVASYLGLLPLLAKPSNPNLGPLPISKSVQFEVFTVATTAAPNGLSFIEPDTDTVLPVANLPIITGADVSTIQLTTAAENQGYSSLSIVLHPTGGNKLLRATTATAKGTKLVVVVDGRVLGAPQVFTPVGAQFRLTGGRIHTEGNDVFRELTGK